MLKLVNSIRERSSRINKRITLDDTARMPCDITINTELIRPLYNHPDIARTARLPSDITINTDLIRPLYNHPDIARTARLPSDITINTDLILLEQLP